MTKHNVEAPRSWRNDLWLIGGLLVVAALGFLYLFLLRGPGDTLRVTVDGETVGVYSLSQDRVEDIVTGEDGAGHNRLVIKDGKAYMEFATCPDGICVSHAPIFRANESIVCLPNRVVLTVESAGEDAPDITL